MSSCGSVTEPLQVMNTFSFEEIQAASVMPFIDAFETLDQMLAPKTTPPNTLPASARPSTSPMGPKYGPERTFRSSPVTENSLKMDPMLVRATVSAVH